MAPLATSTTSTGRSLRGPRFRNTSRSSRFERFLSTAFPTLRLATKPTRSPPSFLGRPNATKSGVTKRRPSRYTRSKSALRRSATARPEQPSVKPKDGAAPCAGAGRGRPGRPFRACARETRGCGCVGADLAGTFFSFRHDSRLRRARPLPKAAAPSLKPVEAKSTMVLPRRDPVNPCPSVAIDLALTPSANFFLSAQTPYARLRPSSGRHRRNAFPSRWGPSHRGFSTPVDISVENRRGVRPSLGRFVVDPT